MRVRGVQAPAGAGTRQPPAFPGVGEIRPAHYLFNIPSLVDVAGRPVGVSTLIDLIERDADTGSDVRVLAPDGAAHEQTLREVANSLGCDVYFIDDRTDLVELSGEIVAVDRATGQFARWRVVRPDDVESTVATWFEQIDGRVRARVGVVSLPVSGGLAFATRDTFAEMAALVHAAPGCAPDVTPVGVEIHDGRFAIGWYSGAAALLDGQDFAKLVSASIDEIKPDVRLAIAWPTDADAAVDVGEQLQSFADALDRHVWVPEPGCRAASVAGLDEPAAMAESGGPASWVAYVPSHRTTWVIGLVTDSDGRLARPGDGSPPSAAEARSSIESEHRHALRVADDALRVLRFESPADAVTLSRMCAAWAAYVPAYEQIRSTAVCAPADLDEVIELRRSLTQMLARSTQAPPVWPDEDDSPTLTVGPRGGAAHNVAWLPVAPLANVEPIDLYIWTSLPPEYLSTAGVCTSDGFLLGRLGPRRLAAASRGGFLLRVHAPTGTAIRLCEYAQDVPAHVQHRAREAWDIFLLPVAWLATVRVRACYELDGEGGLAVVHELDGKPLTVSFKGADHGVPGLPNGAARWPDRRARATAYLAIPDDPEWILARFTAHPGWLPLARRRPSPLPHYRLIEVDVQRRTAIDLPETLASLVGVPLASSTLAGFAGADLVLPSRAFRKTTILKAFTVGPQERWVVEDRLIGRPLADALPEGSWSDP